MWRVGGAEWYSTGAAERREIKTKKANVAEKPGMWKAESVAETISEGSTSRWEPKGD